MPTSGVHNAKEDMVLNTSMIERSLSTKGGGCSIPMVAGVLNTNEGGAQDQVGEGVQSMEDEWW